MIKDKKESIVFVNERYEDIKTGQIPVFNKVLQVCELGYGGSDLSKVLFVDTENGSDLTGEVGNISAPFKTLIYAQTKAVAGDLIEVFPGLYTDYGLGKHLVNWHLHSGVTIQPINPYNRIFGDIDSGGVVVCSITGDGILINKGDYHSDSTCIAIHYPGSIFHVSLKRISSFELWGGANTTGPILNLYNTEVNDSSYVYNGGQLFVTNCFFNNAFNHWGFDGLGNRIIAKGCYFKNTQAYTNEYSNGVLCTAPPVNVYSRHVALGGSGLDTIIQFVDCDFYSMNENLVLYNASGTKSMYSTNCRYYTTSGSLPNIRNDNGTDGFDNAAPNQTNSLFVLYFADCRVNKALLAPSYITNQAAGQGIIIDVNLKIVEKR